MLIFFFFFFFNIAGPRNSPQQKNPGNKYYRRPSNDSGNYINSNYQRNNQRYDI